MIGCVRDALTGRESADIDCEVYGLAPQALRSLAAEFGEVDESGARYGIFSLKGAGIDLAVPRLERRTGPKHGDFDVRLDPALPFARAACPTAACCSRRAWSRGLNWPRRSRRRGGAR